MLLNAAWLESEFITQNRRAGKPRPAGDELAISMPGGELTVSLTAEGGSVRDIYLTGPTNVVCIGDILDEDVLG